MLFIVFMFFIYSNVFALTLDSTDLEIEAGKNKKVNLYADLPEGTMQVEFVLVFDSYDIPVVFNVAKGIKDENPDGPSHTLVFSESTSGKTLLGTVTARVVKSPKIKEAGANLHSAKAIDADGEKTNLNNKDIIVKVVKKNEEVAPNNQENTNNNNNNQNNEPNDNQETNTKEKGMLLDKINSSIVNIELKDKVYEYSVNVKEEVSELDLVAVPKDKKYTVNISNQKISELTDNKITITVINGKDKEEYTIKVNVIKDAQKVEIDDTEFEVNNGYKTKWIVSLVGLVVVLVAGVFLMNREK